MLWLWRLCLQQGTSDTNTSTKTTSAPAPTSRTTCFFWSLLFIHLEDEHTAYLAGLTMGFQQSSRCVGKRLQNPGLTCRELHKCPLPYLSDFSDPTIFSILPLLPVSPFLKAFFFFNKMYAVKFLYLQADGIGHWDLWICKGEWGPDFMLPLWGCSCLLREER